MKTFKMISFSYVGENGVQTIPLIDGVVVNQENREQTWILEVFTTKDHLRFFQKLKSANTPFDVQVVITSTDNEPALFVVTVYDIKEIGERLSVLMKGTIKTIRTQSVKKLLQTLLEEGLSNDDLLERFEKELYKRS